MKELSKIQREKAVKEKLIAELEKERSLFDQRHQDTTDHDVTLNYLKHGIMPSMGVDQYELLDAAINDYNTLCRDYSVND